MSDAGEGSWIGAALAHAPVGMATFGRDLRCVEATEAFAELIGQVSPAAVVGAELEALVGGGNGARLGTLVREVFRTGKPAPDAELRVTRPDGRARWLLSKWFPVVDAHPSAATVGVVLMDVSGRKGLEDRHAALHQLTVAFAAAVTPEVVANVVIGAVLASIDAASGALYLLDDTATRLTVVRSGYSWPPGSPLQDVAVTADLPVAAAVRDRRPTWIHDEAELHSRFPGVLIDAGTDAAWGAHAILPLELGGDVLGAMVFSWSGARRFTTDDRSFLEAVAAQCSQALQRAALFRRERAAREHTERMADYVMRVERITGALAGASEPEEVIDRFLDQCLLELGASHGAVLEVDASRQTLVPTGVRSARAWEPRPVPLDGAGPLAEAARTRQSVLLEGSARFGATAQGRPKADDAVGPLTQEHAWAAVPLVAYGEMIGVVAIRYEGSRLFDADDRAFLDRVGRRLAEAIDRSRLYAHQREAREQAEAAARWLRSVQSLAASLARSATRRDVARALREHLHVATRADFSIVAALSSDRRSLDVLTGTGTFAMSTEQIGASVEGAVRDSILRGRGVELDDADEIAATFPGLAGAGIQGFALLPIRAGRSVIGVIGMGWSTTRGLTADARRLLAIAVSLGGAAFERAAAYDLDHHIAETLQRHLLTEPDLHVPGLSWAARYAPGSVDLTAGGDWYDVIELPGNRIGLVVGDIVGHGIVAAAAMGQLRSATRALAVREHPVGVLEALDAYVTTTGQGHLSSLAYVVFDPAAGIAEYAIAGHPPPLLRSADGSVSFVEDARGPLLGIAEPGTRRSVRHPLEPGWMIVLYTDGLVERRGESIDVGLGRLSALVADVAPSLHPEGLCDHLLQHLDVGGAAPDDITLLALGFGPVTRHHQQMFPARMEMLSVIRGELRSWLAANDVDPNVVADIVLACDEACANAIEHGSRVQSSDTIDLIMHADDNEVTLSIRDAGGWSGHQPIARPTHGLHIMRALMHDVDIVSDDRFTTVTMRRRRSG